MTRLAFFSPLPPCKSGIADYSEALLAELRAYAEVEVFEREPPGFDPNEWDGIIYQLGNNPFHEGAYRTALKHPGIAVLHEFNLHHLITETTIRRDDWDGYLREVEHDGGPEALFFAQRVKAREVGPDYEGVPMMRRVLESSRGLIVHSHFVEQKARAAGFAGPIACIPHGAWTPVADRMSYRQRLCVDETTPLIGIFGFLKPYKRIPEALRAFRRLLRLEPRAKMILGGEAHPDLDLDTLIRTLDIGASVRKLGFTPTEEFTGYLGACDIVLNLRYPTVGETSGTALRALGLGKALLVSDVGAFAEFPDDVCLKVPVGQGEEDLIFEYLNLLVARPSAARELGDNARRWVEKTCNWRTVAQQYAEFATAVAEGKDWSPPTADTEPKLLLGPENAPIPDEEILDWAEDADARKYAATHITRFQKTLELTPRGGPDERILEMGAYMQMTPALKFDLGYGEVRGCYLGPAGKVDHRVAAHADGRSFTCEVDLFNAETDPFPYPDEHFNTVICCELIEHLAADPMHMMSEVNRILKPGGHFVVTTPNIGSLRAISAILLGYHPGFFPAYLRPNENGEVHDARHAREYTPKEIARLLIEAGFDVAVIETGEFLDEPHPEHAWILNLLERYKLQTDLRGDGIYAVGKKTGPPRERYPEWLYN
jgi:glycosyltransferase involved in cell wall biosynthesis/SAM-dependent methyltransferase